MHKKFINNQQSINIPIYYSKKTFNESDEKNIFKNYYHKFSVQSSQKLIRSNQDLNSNLYDLNNTARILMSSDHCNSWIKTFLSKLPNTGSRAPGRCAVFSLITLTDILLYWDQSNTSNSTSSLQGFNLYLLVCLVRYENHVAEPRAAGGLVTSDLCNKLREYKYTEICFPGTLETSQRTQRLVKINTKATSAISATYSNRILECVRCTQKSTPRESYWRFAQEIGKLITSRL